MRQSGREKEGVSLRSGPLPGRRPWAEASSRNAVVDAPQSGRNGTTRSGPFGTPLPADEIDAATAGGQRGAKPRGARGGGVCQAGPALGLPAPSWPAPDARRHRRARLAGHTRALLGAAVFRLPPVFRAPDRGDGARASRGAQSGSRRPRAFDGMIVKPRDTWLLPWSTSKGASGIVLLAGNAAALPGEQSPLAGHPAVRAAVARSVAASTGPRRRGRLDGRSSPAARETSGAGRRSASDLSRLAGRLARGGGSAVTAAVGRHGAARRARKGAPGGHRSRGWPTGRGRIVGAGPAAGQPGPRRGGDRAPGSEATTRAGGTSGPRSWPASASSPSSAGARRGRRGPLRRPFEGRMADLETDSAAGRGSPSPRQPRRSRA